MSATLPAPADKETSTLPDATADHSAAFALALDEGRERNVRLAAVVLGNRDDAEDAVSDAVLRAWRARRSPSQIENLEAWFTQIVVNVCRDRLRARTRVLRAGPESPPRGERDSVDDVAERAALAQALYALSPDHRVVVTLRYLEDLSTEQISRRTGVRPGTVRSRLHYALKALRAAYEADARDVRR